MEKTAAEEIKERAAIGGSSQTLKFDEMIVEQVWGEGAYDGEELTLRLARLMERSQMVPEMAVKSSVPGAGLVKRLYGKLAGAVLAPIFQHQSQYHMELANCMWDMKERTGKNEEQLENRILSLEKQKEELEEHLARLEKENIGLERRLARIEQKMAEQ